MTYRRRRLGCRPFSRMSRRIFLPLTTKPWWRNLARTRPIAVSLELIADNDDFRDEFDVAHRCGRHIIESGAIESGARQSHQTASFADGKTLGPLITDVVALLGRGAFFSAPFRNSISSACRPTMRSRAAIFAIEIVPEAALDPDTTDAKAERLVRNGDPAGLIKALTPLALADPPPANDAKE